MGLTQKNLQDIERLIIVKISESFKQIIFPYVDAKAEEFRAEFQNEAGVLKERMDQHFLSLHEEIEELTFNLGHYFGSRASKKRVKKLEKELNRINDVLQV